MAKTKDMLAKARDRYDSLAKELEELMDRKREIQAKEIMTAFTKSGKSYCEIMNFLDPRGK